MSKAPPKVGIRFGAFEVHPESGELLKHGIRIKLQDQPCKILLALLEKPGEVVTREELRRRIWGEDTFVDFDHSLSAAVNRLREALSDKAEHPRYVETVARRGYRFIAQVDGSPEPETQTSKAGSYRRWVWVTAGLLIFGGLAIW
jgi:DNA-binding winged helix-turn-helix (wHTH) protein